MCCDDLRAVTATCWSSNRYAIPTRLLTYLDTYLSEHLLIGTFTYLKLGKAAGEVTDLQLWMQSVCVIQAARSISVFWRAGSRGVVVPDGML